MVLNDANVPTLLLQELIQLVLFFVLHQYEQDL